MNFRHQKSWPFEKFFSSTMKLTFETLETLYLFKKEKRHKIFFSDQETLFEQKLFLKKKKKTHTHTV